LENLNGDLDMDVSMILKKKLIDLRGAEFM
jgi:hypothetical protein